MQSLGIWLLVLAAQASGFSLVWNCAYNPVEGQSCNAILGLNSSTSKAYELVDLSPFPPVASLAVNTAQQVAYAFLENGTIVSANLASGSVTAVSSGSVNASTDIVDVAVDPATGALYVVYVHDAAVPALAKLEIAKADPASGLTSTIVSQAAAYPFFVSSTIDAVNHRYLGVFATADDAWALNVADLSAGSITSSEVPFGLSGVGYWSAQNTVFGVVSQSEAGINTFVSMAVGSTNATVVGKPVLNQYCGTTVTHGAFDASSSAFFTLCCDSPFCNNATAVTVVNGGTGAITQSVTIDASQAPVSGLFLTAA